MPEDGFKGCDDHAATNLDPSDRTIYPQPFNIVMPSGMHSLPNEQFAMSLFRLSTGPVHIIMQFQRHQLLLHECVTPEGARLLAASLNSMADAAEAQMLVASNAQLGAVLAKGKRP